MTNIFKATDEEIFAQIKRFLSNRNVRIALFSLSVTSSFAISLIMFPMTTIIGFLFLGVTFLVYAFISTWDF